MKAKYKMKMYYYYYHYYYYNYSSKLLNCMTQLIMWYQNGSGWEGGPALLHLIKNKKKNYVPWSRKLILMTFLPKTLLIMFKTCYQAKNYWVPLLLAYLIKWRSGDI